MPNVRKRNDNMKRSEFKAEDLGSQGSLKIRLDYNLAKEWPQRNPNDDPPLTIFFSSHLRFPNPVDAIPPGQLRNMVEIAHKDMTALCARYGFVNDEDIPTTMTLLARGNDILLASSQKGNSFTYRGSGQSQVREWMDNCQSDLKEKIGGNPRHRYGGKCGEQMVAHLYYAIHKEPLAQQKARVITVSDRSVWPPCDGSEMNMFGCVDFGREAQYTFVDVHTERQNYSLRKLEAGMPTIQEVTLYPRSTDPISPPPHTADDSERS